MIDKKRIISKISELDSYLEELDKIKLISFEEYKNSIKDKRACERLLQILIESIIDILNIINSNLKLGLPGDEDELVEKIINKKVLSKQTGEIIKNMKSFRNILVHKYGTIDDELVFELLSEKLDDFEKFKKEILEFIS